ncbi:MAG: sugar ABC transporter permease [Trueperella sp.]|nr:sugar ABC transporter permease [Trueperella sp.]
MKTLARQERRTAAIMLLPSLIGVGIFLIFPIFLVFGISLTDWDLISTPKFVAFDNYTQLIANPEFWNSVGVTLVFSLLAIPLAIILGLLIALGLNRHLPGSRVLQICYVVPWVAAPLTLGVVWKWMLEPRTGLVNSILGSSHPWLADSHTALPVMAFIYIWQNMGYISLFFLAGLQTIPTSLYEAARLDGAGPVRTLLSITVPLLRPTTFFITVTSFISSFQVFDLVYGLTDGNPGYPADTTDVIAAHIYNAAFNSHQLGDAAAMAVLLTCAIVLITLLQQRYFAKRMTYDLN